MVASLQLVKSKVTDLQTCARKRKEKKRKKEKEKKNVFRDLKVQLHNPKFDSQKLISVECSESKIEYPIGNHRYHRYSTYCT